MVDRMEKRAKAKGRQERFGGASRRIPRRKRITNGIISTAGMNQTPFQTRRGKA